MARIRHLADAMHRSYSSNNTAIASNWGLFADGSGNVVWSPVTVSMGSNANDVSTASDGGASTSASAADHVHRGVRSIAAAGSNQQFGNVNLVAGANMAITSVGSNFTFASTGGGGGGSGVTAITANSSNSLTGTVNLKAGSGIALGVSGQDVTFTNIGSGGGGGGGGGSAGALVLLEQHTASSSATLDFTTAISATYDEYLFEIVDLFPATSAVNLLMRMSTDGGSTYDSGANYSADTFSFRAGGNANGGGTGRTSIQLDLIFAGANITTGTAGMAVCGSLRLYGPGSTTRYKLTRSTIQYMDAVPAREVCECRGGYDSLTAVNAVRFLFSSGNISAGTIRCYGVAK